MKRLFGLVCALVLMVGVAAPALATDYADVEVEMLQETIVYDEEGNVDGAYYEAMQRKLIREFEKEARKQLKDQAQDTVGIQTNMNVAPGDVFVSFTGTTSGIDFALVGHASLVETSGGAWAISAWPGSKSPNGIDGVQYEYKYWDNLRKIYGLRVNGSTTTTRQNAVNAARSIVNASPRKPYNWNFLNKFDTNRYYCSQLVWRAWLTAGTNIDRFPYDTVVSPAELTGSHMTTLFYRD